VKKLLAAALLLSSAPAMAQDKPTVESLLKQDYDVVGVMPSNAGPGILLESDDGGKLFLCFVAETPNSPDVTTQYCKPVR
jgi:hypothetical protein